MVDMRDAVLRTFEYIRQRKVSFLHTFGAAKLDKYSPVTQDVLRDLAKFCRANQSCFDSDPRRHAALEGRREVWLRIANHLHLTVDELYALSTGRSFKRVETEDNG